MEKIKANIVEAIPKRLLFALIMTLLAASCVSGPGEEDHGGPPWSNIDSAYKVIENLEYAYNTMDADLYMSCFRNDFEFHYWNDPSTPYQDTTWGYTSEDSLHRNMFSSASKIQLDLYGTSSAPWSGDSTGQSLAIARTHDLTVYTNEAQTEYLSAAGSTFFICRKDTAEQWYVWLWYDQSEQK